MSDKYPKMICIDDVYWYDPQKEGEYWWSSNDNLPEYHRADELAAAQERIKRLKADQDDWRRHTKMQDERIRVLEEALRTIQGEAEGIDFAIWVTAKEALESE